MREAVCPERGPWVWESDGGLSVLSGGATVVLIPVPQNDSHCCINGRISSVNARGVSVSFTLCVTRPLSIRALRCVRDTAPFINRDAGNNAPSAHRNASLAAERTHYNLPCAVARGSTVNFRILSPSNEFGIISTWRILGASM